MESIVIPEALPLLIRTKLCWKYLLANQKQAHRPLKSLGT